jgi:hypothetical protein
VLLVEPQRVSPGRRGITYRYWDWNRRYDADGRRSEAGQPRALHRGRALAVTAWSLPRGEALLARVRHRAGAPSTTGPAIFEPLCGGDDAPLPSSALRAGRVSGTGEIGLPDWGLLRSLTVLGGEVEVGGHRIPPGRTAALPACVEARLRCLDAHAIVAATPAAS